MTDGRRGPAKILSATNPKPQTEGELFVRCMGRRGAKSPESAAEVRNGPGEFETEAILSDHALRKLDCDRAQNINLCTSIMYDATEGMI